MLIRFALKLSLATLCCLTTELYANTALNQATLSSYDYDNDIFHPVRAQNGMVASEHEIASQVGLDILKRGGNAVDAAVAVGFTLAVVLPHAGNLGGGGFLIVHDAQSGKNIALDFREMAPRRASRDMYLDENGNIIAGKSLYSHDAIGVPGTVAGLEYALKKWGSLPLSEVITPAIQLAENGIPVSHSLAKMLNAAQDKLGKWPSSRAIFFQENRPLRYGERLVQQDLAHSLRVISQQGSRMFYRGEIGDKIIAEIQQHQGIMQKSDLHAYKVIERQPIRGNYKGYQIVTMPPPSSGGVHLVQMLNILEQFPLQQWGANSAQTLHYLAESMKLAYADRSKYLGDPDFVHVPVAGLSSKPYAKMLAQQISATTARPSVSIQPNNPIPYESDQTTHYSVVDQHGNVVSVTYTLNFNFGSGIVAAGTGILLNNEMDDFSAKHGVENAFGLIGGDANAIAPYKRPLSSMTPTIVLKNQKAWLVTGSPGGSRIISTVLQTLINSIDFQMNPAEVAAVPRIHHQWLPDEIRVEKGISADTLELLKQKGHKIVQKSTMGRTQTIQILPDGIYGYSDPRNPDGATRGY
ncbi:MULTISPECIES: gamma-glutamyltransferase [unclassified Acinetobacter]|uniref:gamma-glutamyltransferase n=1 Tax=unclassified Acinetobacter TaxID=196816 RepID=UPI00190346A6|nr:MULTISPECIES: gamma-glutamyltransferase [unclassified Acinetobacter]MDD2945180.1 gamma-glutamyltransferase [Acinetobacter sp.]QQN40435.1 gamma-glutamyltransferase [Acinetobacter sp. CS-2]